MRDVQRTGILQPGAAGKEKDGAKQADGSGQQAWQAPFRHKQPGDAKSELYCHKLADGVSRILVAIIRR